MIRISLRKKLHSSQGEMELAVDLEIGAGEFITVFGKSGAGKTTLLRMLAGLAPPDSGRIEVAGETWYDSASGVDRPPQQRRAGLVFQDYALFPHMSVRKNLEFALPPGGDRRRVDEILELTDLARLENRRPETLSGGQKQRVALARALVSDPGVLLLDEPLSALDWEMRVKLQEEIAALHRRFPLPILLVSHDLAEIFRLSHRVVCLEQGRVVKSGKPGEVFAAEGVSGAFPVSGKFKFSGTVLGKRRSDTVYVVDVLVGNDVVKVTALEEDAAGLAAGDRVLLASKAFNPMIFKLG